MSYSDWLQLENLPWGRQVAGELIFPCHQHIVVGLRQRAVIHGEGGRVQGLEASLFAQVRVRLH